MWFCNELERYNCILLDSMDRCVNMYDVIGCESVMNWKGIIVSCKIRFYVGRDGVIKCDSVMN